MGLGQTILTIFSLVILSRLILSINSTALDVGFTKDMAEYRITATSLGTSIQEQINGLAFDEATVDSTLLSSNKSLLADTTNFGPDAGESSVSDYDDVDDYQQYTETDSLQNSAIFKIRVLINYCTLSGNKFVVTAAKGFSKRIIVEVTSDYLVDYSVDPPRKDTLRFYSVYSYWNFR